jgi:zinc transport system substrate-binding protein
VKVFYRGVLALLFMVVLCSACDKKQKETAESGKIKVVTTLFPLYDFTRSIGRDKVDVQLLLPPGMEAHSFEPKPNDIIKANKANLFVYTNRYMEPWAADIIGGLDTRKILVVDTSRGARLMKPLESAEHDHDSEGHGHEEDGRHDHEGGADPHIWLDFRNAQIMVDNILAGLIAKDPANREYYSANALAYKAQLAELDNRYRNGLSTCRKKVFLHGGHYAFGYLANRYGLRYESAYAVSADSEPTPAKIMDLIKKMRANGLRYVYTEELVEPRIADTIARETGATILRLHGAHNISKDDLAEGATFLSLMDRNLKNLRIGLQCTEK